MFPKLSVIRGNHLFKNYALIVFLTNSLLKINLKSLIHIEKGSILLSRLYHTCYINTIDWDYLIKDKSALKPTRTLLNNDCFTQACKPQCMDSNCWSDKNCQLKCPNNCETNCDLENQSQCCSDPLCLYCRRGKNSTNVCVSCSKFRDLSNGKCVSECPIDTLIYENSICIKKEDCSLSRNSLIQGYKQLNGSQCVRDCPFGYKIHELDLVVKNTSVPFQECLKCEDQICKRDCVNQSFIIKKPADLELIKNCFRVKRLAIELDRDLPQHVLTDSLQHLEEISDYLLVTRNIFLTSLNFFKSLKTIHGNTLFEKKFSLFVHTNSKLKDLWNFDAKKFSILNGTVKFFENPNLCFQEIENFMVNSDVKNLQDSDIYFNFNGYRRLTCSNRTIDLSFRLKPMQLEISWNVTLSDLRRLKGFTLSYMQVADGFSFDLNDTDFKSNLEKTSSNDHEWSRVYVEFEEKNNFGKKNI